MPRLALCHQCATLTRLPDPPTGVRMVPARIAWMEDGREVEYVYRDDEGNPVMVAEYDPALEDWVRRHDHPHPETMRIHDIWASDQLTWDTADVVHTVQKEMLDSTGKMYEEREELKADAIACFNKHNRPEFSCPDAFSKEKIIGGHESNRNIPDNQKMYLCHACPFVHGYIVPKVRAQKGYYSGKIGKRVGLPVRRRK